MAGGKSYSVRLTKPQIWAALSAIEGIWESERSADDKAALEKLWDAYQKANGEAK